VGPGEAGVKVVDVVGVEGDNNRTKDDREGEAYPSSLAVRARESDQAATNTPLVRFGVSSDVVDSDRAKSIACIMKSGRI
jgi:hypothetical protein